MYSKQERKKLISRIITDGRIHTQEELHSALSAHGCVTTQATLSRDINEIGAFKLSGTGGESYYVLPSSIHSRSTAPRISHERLHRIEVSGQLCVVKTAPGFASAVAGMIDSYSPEGILGTIAGDDTVLVALRVGEDAASISSLINEMFV